MKKYSLSILSIALISFLSIFSSCVDEEVVGNRESQLTSIKLSFDAPEVEAVLTKGISGKKYIGTIDLFVFNIGGELINRESYEIDSDNTSGTIAESLEVMTGSHYIFALANATGSSFAKIDDLGSIGTLAEFKAKTASLEGSLDLTGMVVPMTGRLDGAEDDGLISITKGGSYTIKLERIVSSVKFDVSCTQPSASFELKSYKVVNVPQTMTLWQKNVSTSTDSWSGGVVSTSGNNKYGFEFYMFENIYNNSTVRTYEDREKKSNSEQTGNDINFVNVPYATYVVLNGHYTGFETVAGESKHVSADVSYYVHLGNTNEHQGGSVSNFETLRNKEYTYIVNIRGINKIVTEVEIKDQPYDRGDGTIGLVGNTYNLDAHYEFFNITIPVNAENNYEAHDGIGSTQNFGWYSFRILDDAKMGYTMPALKPDNTNQWELVMVYMKSGDEAYNDELIQNIGDLNTKLNQCYNDGLTEVSLTCFVDENTGNDYRESVVFRKRDSNNGSSILQDGIRLRQNYMRKFFDNNGKGYAWEVLNETGPLTNDDVVGAPEKDNFNGWKNTRTVVGSVWPTQKEMMKFQKACMSRNRDENGDGRIADDELKWYLPAINQYVGAWMGADALKEARLYKDETLNYLHYVSSTNDGDGKGYYQILWAEEGSANGLLGSDYRTTEKQFRCIRNFGHDNTPDEEPARYYNRAEKVYNFYLTEGYRNIQESGELDVEGGHLGGNNKLYSSFEVGSVKGRTSFAKQKELLKQNRSICQLKEGYFYADYYSGINKFEGYAYFRRIRGGHYSKNDNGSFQKHTFPWYDYEMIDSKKAIKEAYDLSSNWRLPNQRELSMLMAEGFLDTYSYISRTISSFTYLDKGKTRGFMGNSSTISLSNSTDEFENTPQYVRCVRDKR